MSFQKAKIPTYTRELKEERDYWVQRLEGLSVESSIRPDFPRPALYCPDRETTSLLLSSSVVQPLKKLSGDSGLLLYTTMLAALNVCLSRYTGSSQVCVGSPARDKRGADDQVPNALAIVVDPDQHTSFRALLLKVRETLIEAYGKQSFPFERILRDLSIEKADNRSPVFDIVMTLDGFHLKLPDLKNDVTICIRRSDEQVELVADFNPSLFRRTTINRFLGHLENVLQGALQNLDKRISDIDLLSDVELRSLLVEWNASESEFPQDLCIHEVVEARANLNPDATALIFEQERMTYAELNDSANRLAHHLIGLGVEPESIIGLCLENSLDQIVGLLAILKAGGAYLPMDPSLPIERLAFMLENSRALAVVTRSNMVEKFAKGKAKIISIDADRELIQAQSSKSPQIKTGPNNLAYVIYTSGSTGQPKGVLIEHKGICNLAHAQSKAFYVRPESRVIQFASFSFDASVSEIFMALVTGAALCVATREQMLPGQPLADLLNSQSITTATIPPAVLATLPQQVFPKLETIISAGESCAQELAERWSASRKFINAYGPTEVTVCASLFEYEVCPTGSVPIGKPLANLKTFILDRNMQPVPVGCAGELYVGGVGLARGYLSRADLTAEKFVPNPFSSNPGARLYRTGDICCYLEDGNIEFIGRKDHQVKLRGFRIELGEIESTLASHPSVQEAVVIVSEEEADDKRLVAYIVGQKESEEPDLRAYLKDRLPEYMIPAAFVFLPSLPLTVSGKIDRKALPSPAGQRSEAGLILPQTRVENEIAQIWKELLKVETVGVQDNFFDLGGHSLLGTQMVTRIRRIFGVEISLKELFTGMHTISALAQAVENKLIERSSTEELSKALEALDNYSDEEIQRLLNDSDHTSQEIE